MVARPFYRVWSVAFTRILVVRGVIFQWRRAARDEDRNNEPLPSQNNQRQFRGPYRLEVGARDRREVNQPVNSQGHQQMKEVGRQHNLAFIPLQVCPFHHRT